MSPGADASAGLSESDRGLRGSIWLVAGRVVAVALGLATQILLVRRLSTEDYGLWALALALALGLRIVVSLGHTRVIARFFAIYRERGDAARLRGTLVMEFALIGLLGGLALGLGGVLLVVHDDLDATSYLPVLVLVGIAPLEAWEELLESLFAAFGRVRTILVRQHLLIPGLRLVAVATLLSLGAPLLLVAAGYLAVSVVSLSYYAWMARRLLQAEPMFAERTAARVYPVGDVFTFSVPMLSGELVYLVNGTLNVVLLGTLRGPVQVGALRAVMPFADANLLVRRQFYRMFLPLASALHERRDSAALTQAYWRTASWVAVLSFPLFALTGPFAETLTRTLLGGQYAGSAGYLALLAGAYYINAGAGFNAELLHAAARLRFVTVVNLTTATVALATALVLVPRLGAWAVALAAATSVVAQNVLNQLGVAGELGRFWPPAPYRRPYVVVFSAASGLFALQHWLEPSLPVAILLSTAASLLVVALSVSALRPSEAFPELLRLRMGGLRRRGRR